MDDKVNILLVVPEIDRKFHLFLPINKKIGTIIELLETALREITDGGFPITKDAVLYNSESLQIYDLNTLVYKTDIRNGTTLVLLTKNY